MVLSLTEESKKCEKCGKDYQRVVLQDMSRHCVNCGKTVYFCNECVKFGCPECGGRLIDVWTYHRDILGNPIIF